MTVTPTAPADDAPADIGDVAALAGEIDALGDKLRHVRASIGKVIFGQQQVIDQTLITLLAGGHALVIGVPR